MAKRRYYFNGKKCSRGEKKIAVFLTKYNIRFDQEYSYPNLRSDKNRRLRFDFYLHDYNLLLEFQGHHHFQPVNKGYRAKNTHKKTVKHDRIKWNYCNENEIYLLRISHKEYDKIETILTDVLQIETYQSFMRDEVEKLQGELN